MDPYSCNPTPRMNMNTSIVPERNPISKLKDVPKRSKDDKLDVAHNP